MKMNLITVAAALVVCALASSLISAGVTAGTAALPAERAPDAARNPVEPLGRSLTTLSEEQADRLSPLNRDMREILVRETAEIKVMTDQLASIVHPADGLDLQRQISERKVQTQIELLEAQGRHARLAGRDELAEEAETMAARMKADRQSREVQREER